MPTVDLRPKGGLEAIENIVFAPPVLREPVFLLGIKDMHGLVNSADIFEICWYKDKIGYRTGNLL